MKVITTIVLCLIVCLQQATAGSMSLDAIADGVKNAGSAAQGAVETAGSVTSDAAETAGSIVSGVAETASGVARSAIKTATGIAKAFIGAGTDAIVGIGGQASGSAR